MKNLLVRDVSDEVHSVLRRRAERSGMSLQAYLTRMLAEMAGQPSEDEWLERVASRAGSRITPEEAVRAVHEGRRHP